MKIPIIIECIIQKAEKCFKYLLINGIENPTMTIQEQNPEIISISWNSNIERKRYEWDCMSIAIYYGEMENVKILEEKCIEKGSKPVHIEAAILSYRNVIAKEIINKMKENNQNKKTKDEVLKIGIIASVKNNNIKGADINAKDIVDQIIIIFFFIKMI